MTDEMERFVRDGSQPNRIARIRTGSGDDARFETVGEAWVNERSNVTMIRFYGTQCINTPVYLFEKPYD